MLLLPASTYNKSEASSEYAHAKALLLCEGGIQTNPVPACIYTITTSVHEDKESPAALHQAKLTSHQRPPIMLYECQAESFQTDAASGVLLCVGQANKVLYYIGTI